MRGSLRAAVAAFGLAALLVAAAPGSGTVAAAGVRFATPIYIDQQLAGGEPEVLSDPLHGTLVYTSHEGTAARPAARPASPTSGRRRTAAATRASGSSSSTARAHGSPSPPSTTTPTGTRSGSASAPGRAATPPSHRTSSRAAARWWASSR